MAIHIRRREFTATLGSAALAWPLAARAQERVRVRRIGMLLSATVDDALYQAWAGAFLQELAQLDWLIGRNVLVDTRWATADAEACSGARRDLLRWRFHGGAVATGNPHGADRFCNCRRPGRRGLCRKPSATRRQRDRFH